ncbi:MAG: hypothetical protein JXB88_00615 [Spirochaetales bacterium]|nr:hypothetical protein [Spirochaetales bacterium]
MDGKRLERFESSQLHRCKGIVFDRSSEGDFRIKSPHHRFKGPVKKPDKLSDLQIRILKQCRDENKSRSEILINLNLTATGHFKKSLKELLDKKYLEYTIPDKPGSRLQKYKLTARGEGIIK